MTEGKKVVIYARVSTSDQTPQNQLLDLRNHCAARRWSIVQEFIDIGISGAKEDRPALAQLMELARKRFVDGVLVWRFDRFARSLSHLVSALQEFSRAGLSFTSYTENIDTGTAQGKMVFAIIAAMAEFERDIITERINAGIRRARDQGTHLGRPGLPESKIAEVLALRGTGSLRQIAARTGLSHGVVHKLLSTKVERNVASGVDGTSVGI